MTRLLRDDIPGLKYGAKILSNEIAGGQFQGKTYYVKPYSGSNDNDGLGAAQAFKTLAAAQAAATANNGDTVYLVQEANSASLTTDYQASALNWAKDGVHLIGIAAAPMIGSRARIGQLSSVKTIEDLFTLSANNCLIANIEIFQGVASNTATSPRAMVVTGMRNKIINNQISGNGDAALSMDTAGARSLALTGNASENQFIECYIGLDTSLRATALCEVELVGTGGGTKPARNIFDDCMINSYTSLSTFKAIKATYIDRFLLLKNTILSAVQNVTSAVAPTGAIINVTPNGAIYMMGGGVFGYADVSTLDDAKTLLLTYPGIPGTTGANLVGIAQGVDA